MTPEELDDARAKEAYREWVDEHGAKGHGGHKVAIIAARLAREGWTPPEPVVDPDILAFHAWRVEQLSYVEASEGSMTAKAYLAGARMAREQERERAKGLVDCVREAGNSGLSKSGEYARAVLCKYARAGDD